ncbi:hypothetical protein, conserved [Plasmodium gonderi]|uniref:Dynein axonemal assembly factor 5 TPR repeats domain-containing protein n=1 Tax=Plasmodium gonderi TaxID=77519 RepID=A0A1Y1JGW7_PLAGO|nr:hypothetical protein, conserved [Plasmodium gonderi]GAW80898.1 hypothetical protein, conserved [Plasmodium gonderi]
MSNMLHEENYHHDLRKDFEHHIHVLNSAEISDKDKKLNALRVIYEKLLEFFTFCNEEEKEKFCVFFRNYLLHQLHKWINEEFDEYRNFALDIYFLIEKNLNDTLLDYLLFKNVNRDENFLYICTNRLKENKDKRVVEDKEEIRLKIVQFLCKIVNRFRNNCMETSQQLLNIYPYLQDILTALTILIKDPFPLIKKISCQLLYELHFEQEQKDFNHLYKSLVKSLINTLTARQNDVRELALKCLKKLLCFDSNRDFLDDVSECLKTLCRKKSSSVFLQIVDCIEVWNLNIKDLNKRERAKLVFIVLLCVNANISSSFNERCYNVLKTIATSLKGLKSHKNEKCVGKDNAIQNDTSSIEIKTNSNQDEEQIEGGFSEKIHLHDEHHFVERKICLQKEQFYKHSRKATDEYFFAEMNKSFYIPSPSNVICSDIHMLFGEIKKELFYEIMNNERNSWSEGKDDFASILIMFLFYTYFDIFHFIKYIISFVYKSLTLFKYIDSPTTPLLLNSFAQKNMDRNEFSPKDAFSDYGYEYESFLYMSKFLYLIITCGYLMPINKLLPEIAQFTLGDYNIQKAAQSFYKLSDTSPIYSTNENSKGRYDSADHFTEKNYDDCAKYIFSNMNYHKYQTKTYEMFCMHKKIDITLKENTSMNYKFDFSSEKRDSDDVSQDRRFLCGEFMKEKSKNESIKSVVKDAEERKSPPMENHQTKEYIVHGNQIDEESVFEEIPFCANNEYCNTPIINHNKKIVLMMLSQFLAGYHIRKDIDENKLGENKLDDEYINLILFLISENMNYENVDSFPYLLISLKHLLNIIGKECKKYSKILFHFLIILQSDNRFCSQLEIKELIEKIEYHYHGEKNRIDFYNDEYIHFVKNAANIIDFNDFNNFKYNIEFLNTLLSNISEEVMMEQSNCLMNFLLLITNQELKPFMKSEFLLFLNLFCSSNTFPNFFLKYSEHILKNILLPLCTWKSGLNEAQTRKGALYCIRTLFVKNLFGTCTFQNNVLIENLVCVLKSSIDDTWNNANREISISIYGQIVKGINNNNILLDLLNTLLKLLDDSNKTIRKLSAGAMYSLFQNKSLILDHEACENIYPRLLLHMDDECPSVSKIIYHTLSITINSNEAIFIKHAKNSTEYTEHAKFYKDELMKHLGVNGSNEKNNLFFV